MIRRQTPRNATRRANLAMTYLKRCVNEGAFGTKPAKPSGLLKFKVLQNFLFNTDTVENLRTDKDLDPLPSRPDFIKLLDEVTAATKR